ncbi:replication-associated recombination protein A [Pseudoalteromonas sp. SSDWG2]|uniref:replication-associated recombination protein A n=1 Tax=Pseudoalteromonas sp. SSDWG2 TaxID=3139391 RepID=UPI003BAC6D7A
MRPTTLDDYIGQDHILGHDQPLYHAIRSGNCHSLILWGPPGVGKTTLAHIIAHHCDAQFIELSAVTAGVKDIRDAVEQARVALQSGRRSLLFVDEVHRFNKSQQDALLPHVENGTFIFIGATTENPSFALNNAILSRARVYTLHKLASEQLAQVVYHAISSDSQLIAQNISIDEQSIKQLCDNAGGDARNVLNLLEVAAELASHSATKGVINSEVIQQVSPQMLARYDKGGDHYYDLISAFHKSVRGSSPDAALYWYCRIITAGGDPLYVARRLLAIATEDIGNADPKAMQVALNAWDIYHRVGPSEGERAIAQATIYLASAPKSNAVYSAFNEAKRHAIATADLDVPHHLRNAPTGLMKEQGFGEDYRYAHDEPGAYAAGENFFPPQIKDTQYYFPTERGLEKRIGEKLTYLKDRDAHSPRRRYERD